MRLLAAMLLTGALGGASLSTAHAAPAYAVVDRIKGPDGGWDYSAFDAARGRLYVARSTGVMAVDVASGQVAADLFKTQHGHAALPVPGTSLVVSTDSGDDTATLFDGLTGAIAASLKVGKKPDAAAYDPASRTVWIMNAGSGDATVIDPATKAIVATVAIGGALESAAADGQGRLFVNVEDRNELVAIDTRRRTVLAHYPLKGCEEPNGLAYHADAGLLISACANKVAKATTPDGRDAGTLAIGARPDAALYDPKRKLSFIPAGGDGVLTVIGVEDGAPKVVATVATARSARSGAVDPRTGRIYLPSASYGPAPAGGGRPAQTPGSFAVLVVAPQG